MGGAGATALGELRGTGCWPPLLRRLEVRPEPLPDPRCLSPPRVSMLDLEEDGPESLSPSPHPPRKPISFKLPWRTPLRTPQSLLWQEPRSPQPRLPLSLVGSRLAVLLPWRPVALTPSAYLGRTEHPPAQPTLRAANSMRAESASVSCGFISDAVQNT